MKKFTKAAVAVTVAVIAFSGCARSPQTAAEIDGTIITTKEVNALTEGVASDLRGTPAKYRAQVMSSLVDHAVLKKIPAARDPKIVKPDLVEAVAQKNFGPVLQGPRGEFFRDVARASVIHEALPPEDIKDAYSALRGKIRINPEFGSLELPAVVDPAKGPLAQFAPRPQAPQDEH